jgi:hypothetical protein
MRNRAAASGIMLSLLLTACSLLPFHKRGDSDAQDETELAQDIPLYVTNNNWSNIVVFAANASSRVRLGDVTTANEVELVIPRNLVFWGQVTLLVHPIGSTRDYSTGPILVQAGQAIQLRVENNLAQTNWSVSGP